MASAALAKPMQHAQFHDKRQVIDVVTDVVEATAIVTVYATASAVVDAASTSTDASSTDAATSASLKTYTNKWGVHTWTWFHRSTAATSTLATSELASSTPVAASTSVLTVVSSPTSTYVAPTSAAPVPTTPATSAAPAPTTQTTLQTSTTPAASSTTAAAASSYSDIALMHHNIHRSNHSSVPAVWNSTLASIAQEIALSCNYSHNTQAGGGGYGQNIAGGVPADNISAVITDLFYNGEVNWYITPSDLYGAASPDFTNFEHWGHFSQIVWNGSTSVGCYTADCSAQGYLYGLEGDNVPPYFTVCNYYPAGNMGGEYGSNIFKPTSDVSVGWDYGL